MKIAIIPARGGSKRIPHKNIKIFCGKPMIAWSLEQAKISGCFDRIVVSTDDENIAEIASDYGAEVPFIRPANISDDYATTAQVMSHAIRFLEKQHSIHAACCIYATAPFISAEDICRGYNQLEKNQADYVFSITSYAFPIQRALRKDQAGWVSMFQAEEFNTRSQDLEEAYHDAGQFYWGTSQAWKEEKSVFNSKSNAVILPPYRVQDIDSQDDWLRAELMFKVMQQSSIHG